MMGEITPSIAEIISLSTAKKILIPINQPHYIIPGIEERPLNDTINLAIKYIKKILTENK